MKELSNFDIIDYFRYYTQFGGCFSKDELKPNKNVNGKVYILNLEDSTKGGGTHWILVSFIDPKIGVFFDSMGESNPPENILKIMKKNRKENIASSSQFQPLDSNKCGYYCCYMAMNLIKGRNFIDILSDFRANDKQYNEDLMKTFWENRFKNSL